MLDVYFCPPLVHVLDRANQILSFRGNDSNFGQFSLHCLRFVNFKKYIFINQITLHSAVQTLHCRVMINF